MSGKLDQSLDEIMKDRKTTAGGANRGKGRPPARRAANRAKAATAAVVAPAGGIQKSSKTARVAKANKPNFAVAKLTNDSKISVSGLPDDANEPMIKDYFLQIVGPVKRVILNYGPSGRSRGSATVIFNKPTAASEAAKFDGVVVDGKPLKIEVLLGASSITPPAPPKPLSERTSKPKNAAQEKTKSAAANGKGGAKPATGKGGRNGGNNKKPSGRAGRPKPKTTEELDAEMQDYFGGGGNTNGATTNGTAQPAAIANGGDTGMVDEVM